MSNTLDEAIKHCLEIAEKNEEECKNWAYGASRINDDESRKKQYLKHAEMWQERAAELRQLAEWLRELQRYKFEISECKAILDNPTPDVTENDRKRAMYVLQTFPDVRGDER